MRFRMGLAIGFGVGYYLGAKAGQERYLQMQRWLEKAKDSHAMEVAAEKAQALVDLGVERARDLVDREHNGGNGATARAAPPTMPL